MKNITPNRALISKYLIALPFALIKLQKLGTSDILFPSRKSPDRVSTLDLSPLDIYITLCNLLTYSIIDVIAMPILNGYIQKCRAMHIFDEVFQ